MTNIEPLRTWATTIYPDDNKDWLQLIEDLKIPCYISPEHNMDTDENGNLKKNHRHVLFVFQGKKSEKQMRVIIEKIHGVGLEPVASLQGYLFYLCHLNSPNKHLYAIENVIALNGAKDYLEEIGISSINHSEVVNQMIEWCDSEHVVCFSDLVDYARKNRKDWFRILVEKNSSLIVGYLKAKNWKYSKKE